MTSGAATTVLPIDLATPAGRRRARKELIWGDHGFLRLKFRNLHRISDEMYRANQPSPEHIARYAKELGLKTILNLRGESPKGYYLLEKEACDRNGIKLVDFQMFSRDIPSPENVLAAKKLFDSIAYPALMHCKSGADRAGIMAVLYMHFRKGQPIDQALEMLSRKYLHIRQGKTGVLDFFFETYLAEGTSKGLSFQQWVEKGYDRAALKAKFLKTRKSKLNVDELIRRE
jgi:protein tyrosine/serine phosphatase